MSGKIREWLEERWPVSSLVRLAVEEEIPGGARCAYTLGSSILVVFSLVVVSGIMQLFFYVPSTDHAYNSLSFLRTRVPFGWLIHGVHYWGAQLMIILVLFHMARVFLWGAYKKPRELTWLAGVTLFLTVMGFSFTGGPLHWDQRGYWIGEVSTSIAGTVPLLGDVMKQIVRGGEEMGQLALSRLFVIHVAVLPGALIALIGFHLVAMRRFGSAGPWDEAKRQIKGPFWPDQVFRDAVIGTSVVLLLVLLVVLTPPKFSGMADPLDLSYIPKPEWNFLFLYESLKYFEGPLEPVGTVGIPTVLVLMLVLLPFIDRNPERNPLRRPLVMLGALILSGVVAGISVKGYLSPGFAQAPPEALGAASESRLLPMSVFRKAMQVKSSEAAKSSPGEAVSPPSLPAAGDQAPSSSITESRPGKAVYIIGSAERGAELYKKNCSSCHGPGGVTNVPNPGSLAGKVPNLNPIERELYSPDARTFAERIDRYIQHGSVPAGPNPAIRMPVFGDNNTLTQQEISNIEAYVLSLNGVDRAQLVNPGMQPRSFLLLVAVVYVLIILVLGGIWNKRSRRTG
jgi:quinol-cytochrome oxidoreductase complex cytochrome b subunit/mono/diheme cytochrome c family protein